MAAGKGREVAVSEARLRSEAPDSLEPAAPYSALIFDCDGTLVDSRAAHYAALSGALAPWGVALDRDWYFARTGVSTRELLNQLLREGNGRVFDPGKVLSEKDRRYGELVETVTAVEAVAVVARAYRGWVPLAVASGSPRSQVEASLCAAGIYNLFDTVVTYDDVGRGKPAPDLFLVAAERLGVKPGGCVVYEDSDEGLRAAKAAGMRAIDVRLFVREVGEEARGGGRAGE